MVHPEYRPKRPTSQFVARLYGFKIHPMAYQLQQVTQPTLFFPFWNFSLWNVQIYVTPVFLASHHYTALWGFWKLNISILASRTKFQQTKNDTKTLKRKILLQNLSNPKPYFTFISECTRQIKTFYSFFSFRMRYYVHKRRTNGK